MTSFYWLYDNISMEGVVQHCPRYECRGWGATLPKRQREDPLDGCPKVAKALKTLDDEGVLNGYRANFAANRNEAHYKNKGVANGIAEGTAKYMLHSNIEDRGRLCEKLITRKTSICSVVKVIEAYRKEQATLTQQNRIDARAVNRYGSGHGSRVLEIDSNGVLH